MCEVNALPLTPQQTAHDNTEALTLSLQHLRWLGHVARMDSSNPVRKVFESEPGGGYRRQGRPPQRWAKQVDENLRIQVSK